MKILEVRFIKKDAIQMFLEPKSVAIIGASEEEGRIGSGLYKSISQGFQGEIFLVNPKYEKLWNQTCYHSILDLPVAPSHVIIAVSRTIVNPIFMQCIEKGIKNITVVSSGFKELDHTGLVLENELKVKAQQHGITLLGPNTLGFINTSINYNGTFLPNTFEKGGVSVISQSGGVGMALLASLQDQRCGIAKWVGIGNEAVLDSIALLKYFENDVETKVIAVCFEGLKNLIDFLTVAEKINFKKPIVILRDGKSNVGMEAALSHTGKMAQPDKVMTALIHQHGLIEAESLRECAVILKSLSIAPLPKGNRVSILTNTAGPSILAADILEPSGIALPAPSQELMNLIDRKSGIAMQLKNPADVSSNGLTPSVYGLTIETLINSNEYDLALGFFSLNPHLKLPDKELIDVVKITKKPIIACFLSSLQEFLNYDPIPEAFGIPCFYDPQDAAIAVRALIQYSKQISSTDHTTARKHHNLEKTQIESFLKSLNIKDNMILEEKTSRELLCLAGIDSFIPVLVQTGEEAVEVAREICGPVVMKIHSSKITHKSDSGGVRLNLKNSKEILTAFTEMKQPLLELDPTAQLTLQPMEAEGLELIIGGIRTDETGTLVMVGTGGIYSEIFNDVEFRLAPISETGARKMIRNLKSAPIMEGVRGEKLAIQELSNAIVLISELMDAFPRIKEIDINPCRLYKDRISLLDARVILGSN